MKSSAMLACALVAASGIGSAGAQSYPARPVRMVIPFPSGGSIDTIARPVAVALGDALGQQVVVDNRGAGAGIVGSDLVAKAPADGYTLLMTNVAFVITPSLVAKLPYDPLRDFAPVTQLTTLPYLLVAAPSLPAASLQELVALAKARPRQITFASLGNGSGTHLTGAMLQSAAAIELVHVPYKGFGALMPDLLVGRVQLAFNTIPALLPHVRNAKLRPLVLTTPQRSPLLPEVPTSAEAGLPQLNSSTWHGVFAPAGTPKNIIAVVNSALAKAVHSRELAERLVAQGAEPVGSSAERFAAFVRMEIAKWKSVAQASGATID